MSVCTFLYGIISGAFKNVHNLISCHAGFFEERALLLGRLGRHKEALAIYIHVLNDIDMASQ